MKTKFLQSLLLIGLGLLFIWCNSFRNDLNTHYSGHQTSPGYVPSDPGTQLTYHVHSVAGGASSDADMTYRCFGVLDSVAWVNAQSASGSRSMIAMVNAASTIYPAMPHEEYTNMVNGMKRDEDASVSGSNGYVWAVFPNNATVGSPVIIQYPSQFFKTKTKKQSLDVVWTFQDGLVSAKEKVTTPAGVFDCIKASYSYKVDTRQSFPGFDKTTRVMCTRVYWLCKGVGVIKNETDVKNRETGAQISHSKSELTKITVSKKDAQQGGGDSAVHQSDNRFTIKGGEYGGGTTYNLGNDKRSASGLLEEGRITATLKDAVISGNNRDEITIVLDFPAKSAASYTLPAEDGDNEATIGITHYQNGSKTNTHQFTINGGILKILHVDKKLANGQFDFKSTDADPSGIDAKYHITGNFRVALMSL